MTRPGKVHKMILSLTLLSFFGIFGLGCTCFIQDCPVETPKTTATPVIQTPPPAVDYSRLENAAKKAEASAGLAEAAAKKAEMAAEKAELAANRAEKAADKAEAAANKAEAIFMKKMKK
jgi:hypothetical protein